MMSNIKYTIPALFQETLKKFADNTSLVYAGESNYTYRQMGEDVMRIAALLKSLGIQKGDKVALLGVNMPAWGTAFFAISWGWSHCCSNLARFSSQRGEINY